MNKKILKMYKINNFIKIFKNKINIWIKKIKKIKKYCFLFYDFLKQKKNKKSYFKINYFLKIKIFQEIINYFTK